MSTVLLVDSDSSFRLGVKKVLGAEFEFVGQASSSTVAEQLWVALKPQLVIVDIAMSGMLEVVKRQRSLATRVLVLTERSGEDDLVLSVAAGVDGYILKKCTPDEFLAAVENVVSGLGYIYPEIFYQFLSDGRGTRINVIGRRKSLTTRECEVLKLLAEGNSAKKIACDLKLSIKTVEAHRFHLMQKLDIHNRAQLVQYAVRKKIITVSVDDGDTAA